MKKNWYQDCADIVYEYKMMKKYTHNDAYETINKIFKVLDNNGFLDSDWWAEIEPGDPRYK